MRGQKSMIATFALVALVWMPSARGDRPIDQSTNAWQHLIGSWQVTSAQTSLVLSIEPDHQVLVLWMRPGSHSMGRTSWSAMPGGILIQDAPRIRLWEGRDGSDNELRAEVETIPEIGFDPNKDFHDHFFMRRVRDRDVPQGVLDRPLPARWQMEILGEEWNETAGRKPLPRNATEAEQTPAGDVLRAAPKE
ncbi:MAG: hypothetical protein PHR35_04375 [Kiritimatiellae bacterium]|nr:hypothetical protein [Kiritimatiellia bacterium]